jgi:predicted DNA-binding transcriptional regulator AlpA
VVDSAHSWKQRLTTAEAADYLGASVATLRAWRLKGADDPSQGPRFIRLSQTLVVYDLGELDRWLNSKLVATVTALTVGAPPAE